MKTMFNFGFIVPSDLFSIFSWIVVQPLSRVLANERLGYKHQKA